MLYKFSKENYCNTNNDGSNTIIDFSNTNEEEKQKKSIRLTHDWIKENEKES